jgi:hypothetical protein
MMTMRMGNTSANVIPQTCYPQNQTLYLITLLVNRYPCPAVLAIGRYLSWARQRLSLLRFSATFAFGCTFGRQLVNSGVSANPADQIHVLRQRLNHLTFGIWSIGRDAPLDFWKGLGCGLNHFAGQFLTRAKHLFGFAVRTLSIQCKDRRKNPPNHRPTRQSDRYGSDDPVVCPVNNSPLVRTRTGRGIFEPSGMSDVFAASGHRGIVDSHIGHGFAGEFVQYTRFEDHRINHTNQQRCAQTVEGPSSSIEELLVDRPVPVGQIAESSKYAGHSHGPASENPARYDLLPSPGRRFGEDIGKLKNKTVSCRYKRCSIHADLPIHCWSSNLHIGLSASLLSLLHLQISAKVHIMSPST